MTLLIKIPKEFEQHFKDDRFEDSLNRLSADAHLLAGNYEQETAIMLINAFKYAVQVEETTNADRIRAMTDEELANILTDVQINYGWFCSGVSQKQAYPFPNCWLDWLKQEVSYD